MTFQTMLRGPVLRGVLGLSGVLGIIGCSGTSLNNMWRDPSYTGKSMQNILVIGVRSNDIKRRIWEDAFVGGLKDKGVTATPSYQLFPSALPDTDQVVDKVRENGYDGVLVVSRLNPKTTTTYVPGYTTSQPVSRYNRWRGYYTTQYREVYTPGYTETSAEARNEIVLWSTGDDARMVWTGSTATLDPNDGDSVRKEVIDAVIPQLDDQHLLAGKK